MFRVAAVVLALVALSFAACQADAGDEPASPPATPVAGTPPAREPEPTAPPASSPTPPALSGPTGVVSLDRLIHTVAARDIAAVERRVKLTAVPCSPARQGPGSFPACEPGQVPGTPVEALPYATCSDQFAVGPAISAVVEAALSPERLDLRAVVRVQAGGQLGFWPGEEYGIVYQNRDTGSGMVLVVDGDGSLRRIHRACGAPAATLVEYAGTGALVWAAA